MDACTEPCLIVYGRHSCGRSHWLYQELENNHIDFEWRDIVMGEPRFKEELKALARGNLSVPTVIFPDGSVMVEPRPDQVLSRLQASPS
ncbi:MAG: glutaredoxin domain-containing protein [Anaerolineae bacterium]